MTFSFKPLLTAALTGIALTALAFSTSVSHAAERKQYLPVTAVYLVKDASVASGYKEKVRWVLNNPDIWENMSQMLTLLPSDRTVNADPRKNEVDDVIILIRNELNGMTGFDVYISSVGIMTIDRGAEHAYFADTNLMWEFLEGEQENLSTFDNFAEAEYSKTEKGIVATLNLNQNLPNPHWQVPADDTEKIKLYNSYLKGIRAYSDYDLRMEKQEENFDSLGLFVLNLNYPEAPAEVATVSKNSIRLSNSKVTTSFYQDTQDQYPIFRRMAQEMITHNAKYKKQEVEAVGKREF